MRGPERPNEMFVRWVRIIHVSPQRKRLIAQFCCRRMLGAESPTIFVYAIFFAKDLRDVSSNNIDDRFHVGFV